MKCRVTEISDTTLCEAICVVFFSAWLDFINILLCTGMFSSPIYRLMGCPPLSDDKQPAAVNDSSGIFGTFFTLRWLRARRIIISQLCFMSLNTGHASMLLRETSICEAMISKCSWGKRPLTPNMTNAALLLTSISWLLFPEVLSVNLGQVMASWQGMIRNLIYSWISKVSWHAFMWKVSVLLRID